MRCGATAFTALLVVSCTGNQQSKDPGTATARPDLEACTWEDGQPALREWNRAAAVWVNDYLDISVSANDFVQTSRRVLPTLEQVVYELQDVRDCMSGVDQAYMRRLVSLYNDKVTALQALETAVLLGSLEGEENALRMLDSANAGTSALACEIAALTGNTVPGAIC